jgi:hypothetical protein
METNPYAPPKAVVADVTSIGLKRRSVILMFVFTLLTAGLYYPIWFLRRRAALNQLDSPRKLRLWPFVIMLIWFTLQFVASFLAGLSPRRQLTGEAAALVSGFVQLGVAVLMLVQSFFTKDILEDHLAGPGDQLQNPLFTDTVKLSGVMTFLFQVFYLQYVINRYIVSSKSRAA